MCTVTYLPFNSEGFILTSNRDESPIRKTLPPQRYLERHTELIYPRDKVGGGTWIGVSSKSRLVCLLNGGFERHERTMRYRMSRGIVVTNLLTVDRLVRYIENVDFNNIEPFTIILIDWSKSLKTYELVWDGLERHFQQLDHKPKIWSSSMLYTSEMRAKREEWFKDWLTDHPQYDQKDIVDFHQNTDRGTKEYALRIKRPFVETVSMTSVKKDEQLTLDYIHFRDVEKTFIQL